MPWLEARAQHQTGAAEIRDVEFLTPTTLLLLQDLCLLHRGEETSTREAAKARKNACIPVNAGAEKDGTGGSIHLFVSKPHQSPGGSEMVSSTSPALKHETKSRSDWMNFYKTKKICASVDTPNCHRFCSCALPATFTWFLNKIARILCDGEK